MKYTDNQSDAASSTLPLQSPLSGPKTNYSYWNGPAAVVFDRRFLFVISSCLCGACLLPIVGGFPIHWLSQRVSGQSTAQHSTDFKKDGHLLCDGVSRCGDFWLEHLKFHFPGADVGIACEPLCKRLIAKASGQGFLILCKNVRSLPVSKLKFSLRTLSQLEINDIKWMPIQFKCNKLRILIHL